ncbi:MAG: tetratricopeptide repeat protein [Rhodospirillaceae bacterium]|nr:tetratricopeptide repeat protein [Rhodospirillaceae bacterium]
MDGPASCDRQPERLDDRYLPMTPETHGPGQLATAAQIQAKFLEGWAHHQNGRLGEAWAIYQQVIALQPRHFDALHLAGIIAAQTGHIDQAVALIGRALDVDPNNAAAHYNRGNALGDLGRHQEAIASFDKAIGLEPNNADPYNNRGNALWALRRHREAVDSFDRAIQLKPDFAEAHNNRGNALRDLKHLDAAIASFENAITLKPDYAEAYNNRGNALRDLKYFEAAILNLDKAIALKPDYAEAYHNRGHVCRDQKRYGAAGDDYDKAIALKTGYAEAYYSRGTNFRALKKFQAAIDDYDRAIALRPGYAEAHNNRGVVLSELGCHEESLASYDQAIQLKPAYSEAYNNMGVAFQDLKQLELALEAFDKAIDIKADSAEAYNNRGSALNEMKRFDAAISSYSTALQLNPSYPFLYGIRLYTKLNICEWTGFDSEIDELLRRLERGELASPPFSLLTLISSPGLLREGAEIWMRDQSPRNSILGALPRRSRSAKIKLGYFSMDFHNHPVSQLTAGVIEAHDREKFEVIAFSYGPASEDALRKRMEAAVDTFVDVRSASDMEIAEMARRMEIDIAVDLAGYTGQPRTGIFAIGAAPIQVNYLGYPGTMGADYYDYIVADHMIIPEDGRHHYAEKIVYMPHSYQPNDATRKIADKIFTREELGLPPIGSGFVFCCFNINIKISPGTFAGWMRILNRVEGSVLWLLEDNSLAAANLRREAKRQGVDERRLVFAPRTPFSDNLARQRVADLFLDTLPYNAHTTASDTLWAGLPILTCAGESFAGRVAAGILTALDLPELITFDAKAYEDRAVALATNPDEMEDTRRKLARNRLTAPLFNAALYARHIESAYTRMYERSQAGLSPDHIFVEK